MRSRVIVDTNWLLDIALRRDGEAERLWDRVRTGTFELLVPAFCLMEAIKTVETMRGHWTDTRNALARHAGDLRRSAALGAHVTALEAAALAFDDVKDRAERQVYSTLQEVAAASGSLVLDVEALARIADIRTQLNPSPADAAVLATVVVTNEREASAVPFLSRDAWFGRAAPARFLRDRQIPHFADAGALLAWAGA